MADALRSGTAELLAGLRRLGDRPHPAGDRRPPRRGRSRDRGAGARRRQGRPDPRPEGAAGPDRAQERPGDDGRRRRERCARPLPPPISASPWARAGRRPRPRRRMSCCWSITSTACCRGSKWRNGRAGSRLKASWPGSACRSLGMIAAALGYLTPVQGALAAGTDRRGRHPERAAGAEDRARSGGYVRKPDRCANSDRRN